MAIQLEGGDRFSYKARVDADGQILANSSTKFTLSTVSEKEGLAFTWSSTPYASAAGDTILLLKNTSPNKHLHITRISGVSDTATEAQIHFPGAATLAGTSVTGVNLNRTSGKAAEAEAYSDETGTVQGSAVFHVVVPANLPAAFENDGAIILGTNDQIAVDFTDATGAASVTITGYYEVPSENV